MNLQPLFAQLFSSLWYLIPIFIIVALIKSPWFKGYIGETIVNLSAKLFLDKNEYHLLRNVTLPTEDGTTQIDHIIVSQFGIFVVETKNMKGWIFGDKDQATWTQKIFKTSNKFQNPLRQNYKHVKTLESVLQIDSSAIFSVVVFVGDSEFKTEMPENVTFGGGYIRYIKSKSTRILSEAQVNNAIAQIAGGRLKPSLKTNIQHVQHVKSIIEAKATEQKCPNCGRAMLIREAKSGSNAGKKFWGCSGYPKCRGVVNFT